MTLRNTSRRPLALTETIPERDFKIVVRNQYGEAMPLTRYGHRLAALAGPQSSATLPGGAQKSYQIVLNRVYDMTQNYVYTITAQRSIQRPDGSGVIEIESGPITINSR